MANNELAIPACITARAWRAVMDVGIAHPRWRGNVPGILGHAQPAVLRVWQEAHGRGIHLTFLPDNTRVLSHAPPSHCME